MPPEKEKPAQELRPPASDRTMRAFARAMNRRALAFTRPGAGVVGAQGRAAAGLAQSLTTRTQFTPAFRSANWLTALLSRHRAGAWSSDTPVLFYLRWLRGQARAEDTEFSAFDSVSAPVPVRSAAFTSERGSALSQRRDDQRRASSDPSPAFRAGRVIPQPRTPLLPNTLNATNILPAVLQLHHAATPSIAQNLTARAPVRAASPERLAEDVARRASSPARRPVETPEQVRAELGMALSYPPVPLVSWLGQAASAPEQAAWENAPGFTGPAFHPAGSHLLALPNLPSGPQPMLERPSQTAFAALPRLATRSAARTAAEAASESVLTARSAAIQPLRVTTERRSPTSPVGMRSAPAVPVGPTASDSPSDGDAHPARSRGSLLQAAQAALKLLQRVATTEMQSRPVAERRRESLSQPRPTEAARDPFRPGMPLPRLPRTAAPASRQTETLPQAPTRLNLAERVLERHQETPFSTVQARPGFGHGNIRVQAGESGFAKPRSSASSSSLSYPRRVRPSRTSLDGAQAPAWPDTPGTPGTLTRNIPDGYMTPMRRDGVSAREAWDTSSSAPRPSRFGPFSAFRPTTALRTLSARVGLFLGRTDVASDAASLSREAPGLWSLMPKPLFAAARRFAAATDARRPLTRSLALPYPRLREPAEGVEEGFGVETRSPQERPFTALSHPQPPIQQRVALSASLSAQFPSFVRGSAGLPATSQWPMRVTRDDITRSEVWVGAAASTWDFASASLAFTRMSRKALSPEARIATAAPSLRVTGGDGTATSFGLRDAERVDGTHSGGPTLGPSFAETRAFIRALAIPQSRSSETGRSAAGTEPFYGPPSPPRAVPPRALWSSDNVASLLARLVGRRPGAVGAGRADETTPLRQVSVRVVGVPPLSRVDVSVPSDTVQRGEPFTSPASTVLAAALAQFRRIPARRASQHNDTGLSAADLPRIRAEAPPLRRWAAFTETLASSRTTRIPDTEASPLPAPDRTNRFPLSPGGPILGRLPLAQVRREAATSDTRAGNQPSSVGTAPGMGTTPRGGDLSEEPFSANQTARLFSRHRTPYTQTTPRTGTQIGPPDANSPAARQNAADQFLPPLLQFLTAARRRQVGEDWRGPYMAQSGDIARASGVREPSYPVTLPFLPLLSQPSAVMADHGAETENARQRGDVRSADGGKNFPAWVARFADGFLGLPLHAPRRRAGAGEESRPGQQTTTDIRGSGRPLNAPAMSPLRGRRSGAASRGGLGRGWAVSDDLGITDAGASRAVGENTTRTLVSQLLLPLREFLLRTSARASAPLERVGIAARAENASFGELPRPFLPRTVADLSRRRLAYDPDGDKKLFTGQVWDSPSPPVLSLPQRELRPTPRATEGAEQERQHHLRAAQDVPALLKHRAVARQRGFMPRLSANTPPAHVSGLPTALPRPGRRPDVESPDLMTPPGLASHGSGSARTRRRPNNLWEEGSASDAVFAEAVGQVASRTLQSQLLLPLREFLLATLSRVFARYEVVGALPSAEDEVVQEAAETRPGPVVGGFGFPLFPGFGGDEAPGEEQAWGVPTRPLLSLPSFGALSPPVAGSGLAVEHRRVASATQSGFMDSRFMTPTRARSFVPQPSAQSVSRLGGAAISSQSSLLGRRPDTAFASALTPGRRDVLQPMGWQGQMSVLSALDALTAASTIASQPDLSLPLRPASPRHNTEDHDFSADIGALIQARTSLPRRPDGRPIPGERAREIVSVGRPVGSSPGLAMPLPGRHAQPDGQAATMNDPLIIQRAVSGSVSAPGASGQAGAAGLADAQGSGGEVDVQELAKEVWTHLRRRIKQEAARAGRG